MKMIFDFSEEFGHHEGLGLIPGRVAPIPPTGADGKQHKIPHIGWNSLEPPSQTVTWDDTILVGVAFRSAAYFVHSFTAIPRNRTCRLADSYYNGKLICAAIQSGNTYGCQFHPEKSGEIGLKIIQNFSRLTRE